MRQVNPFFRGAPFALIRLTVPENEEQTPSKPAKKPHRWRRRIFISLIVLVGLLGAARLAMPSFVRWYVNGALDQNPMYDGSIGDVEIHLWRGSYSIDDVKLNK